MFRRRLVNVGMNRGAPASWARLEASRKASPYLRSFRDTCVADRKKVGWLTSLRGTVSVSIVERTLPSRACELTLSFRIACKFRHGYVV
jgi:hypothetical protein